MPAPSVSATVNMQHTLCMVTVAGGAPMGWVVPWGCPWVGTTVGGPMWARLCTKQACCPGVVSCLTGSFYVHLVHARVGRAGGPLAMGLGS